MHILQKRPRNVLTVIKIRLFDQRKVRWKSLLSFIPLILASIVPLNIPSWTELPHNSVDIFSLHFPKIPHDLVKKMLSSSENDREHLLFNFISMEDNSFVSVFYVSYFLIFQSIIPRRIHFLEKAGLFGCRLHAMARELISYVYHKFYFTYWFLW